LGKWDTVPVLKYLTGSLVSEKVCFGNRIRFNQGSTLSLNVTRFIK
jgi:hypothetical protein